MGPVTKIIGLATKPSDDRELAHLSLTALVRLRLIKRMTPAYSSLGEFFKIRISFHIVEEINGDFFCDCYYGIKGHLCRHTMALTFDRTNFAVDPRLNAVKFTRRKKGRPKKLGLALTREPSLLPEGDAELEGKGERWTAGRDKGDR